MGYFLKTNIPLSSFLCDNCLSKKVESHHNNNGAAYIQYDIPIDLDQQQLTVSIDIKKITWQRINPMTYLAYSEMYVDCPLCNWRHSIRSKVEAPKIFLENSISCDECHSDLSLTEECISLEEENGREKITIKGLLICQSCGKNISIKHCQEPTEILSASITLLQIQSKTNELRIEPMKFKIGVTFTGTHRSKVRSIVNALLFHSFNKNDIFFDEWHDALINGIDADMELRNIYANSCDCIVVFLAKDYNTKPWTRGVEWRAIRQIINAAQGKKVCLLNVDGVDINLINGLSSFTDIAKNIKSLSNDEIAEFIRKRYEYVISN